jgi:hypothetical protein
MNYDPLYGDIKIGLGCIPLLIIIIVLTCILTSSVWFLVR